MGVPIPQYKDEPLKRRKGFFSIRQSTSSVVGTRPSEVFPEQPQCWSLFHPLLAFPGHVVCNTWDVTLHFIYGPLRSGGTFFKASPGRRLVFLGTAQHGRIPDGAPMPTDFAAPPHDAADLVTPGYMEFHEWIPGETDSDDEAGFHEVPAVFLGGEPTLLLNEHLPQCLCCQRDMRCVGQVESDAFSDELFSVGIVLLYCEHCEVQCCVDFE